MTVLRPRFRAATLPLHAALLAGLALGLLCACVPAAEPTTEPAQAARRADPRPSSTKPGHVAKKKSRLDHSGRARTGKASWYGHRFAGKTMADGTPMKPGSNNAASKTLPLGTTARVTNLDNGKSAVVHIRDRGPYVDGRIIDVSPRTARHLDMLEDGVAPVKVAPIRVPLPDGGVRVGAGARASQDACDDKSKNAGRDCPKATGGEPATPASN